MSRFEHGIVGAPYLANERKRLTRALAFASCRGDDGAVERYTEQIEALDEALAGPRSRVAWDAA